MIPADRVAEMVRSLVDIITSPTSRPREKTSALQSLMQVRQLNLEAIRTALEARLSALEKTLDDEPQGNREEDWDD